jgi:hypothetical protein
LDFNGDFFNGGHFGSDGLDAGCYYVSTTVRSYSLAQFWFQFFFKFDGFQGGRGVPLTQDARMQNGQIWKKIEYYTPAVGGYPLPLKTVKLNKKLKAATG